MDSRFTCSCIVCIVALLQCYAKADIQTDTVEKLVQLLTESGPYAKVGFLSSSNYASVKSLLPLNVQPFYVEHDAELIEIVLNGTVNASLMTGLPEQQYHDKLNIFGSTVITMHSILIAPDYSAEYPHGIVSSELSSYDLSRAINAAVSRVQLLGIDQQLARKNAPKEIAQAHTCKDDDQTQFAVPNKKDATGLLKVVLQDRNVNVLADGPYDWGMNDGNYLVDPPVGFYPDLLQAIVDQVGNLSGPDNEPYGSIKITRIFSKNQPFPWYKLFNGMAHMSEPYFIYDAPYSGSNQPCNSDTDCPNVADLPERKESCTGGFCRGLSRPRSLSFRAACTATATEAQFITKKQPETNNNNSEGLDAGTIVALVLLSVGFFVSSATVILLIYKGRSGRPLRFF